MHVRVTFLSEFCYKDKNLSQIGYDQTIVMHTLPSNVTIGSNAVKESIIPRSFLKV